MATTPMVVVDAARKAAHIGLFATAGERLHREEKRAVAAVESTDAARALEEAWSALMLAAQGGDARAYAELLAACGPFVRAVARRRCRDEVMLDDIVQETLLTVHRVRMTYDPRRSFRAWLGAIAERRAIDAIRKRARTTRRETKDERAVETFPDPVANRMDRDDAPSGLVASMASLPERQREALELVKVKEMSLKEAASVSGQSVGALKVNVHRAIRTLRERFSGDEG